MSKILRHFLDLSELPTKELRNMLAASVAMKAKLKRHEKPERPLQGKTLAMIFEKPSLRTRVSFSVAMTHLGGSGLILRDEEVGLGKREPVQDVAPSKAAGNAVYGGFQHADVGSSSAKDLSVKINSID
jgi:ornithine carbamoyltransferase